MGHLLLVVGLAVGVLGALGWRRRRDAGAAPDPTPPAQGVRRPGVGLDPGLDEALTAVLDAHGSLVGDLLEQRLRGLVARQVPVRAIRPAPGVRTGRVCFADGTVVLARSAQGGELAAIAMAMHRSSILLTGYARDGGVTRLDLRGRTGQPMALLAVGLDQPD
ncbi:hypothetical protein [Lapillicoccus jejuensis]|uniref:Uncharacterized protein n=1 Tax=Lapillicoccus jejuensis TaxID=402171 RepID=A0A542DVR2_9MICO|nr:hypothetical protein [Lapillicoccus jejuensis]TQJ07125.1 hypothetical protein FB458_0174 [Lapillicoccus jejuensis]